MRISLASFFSYLFMISIFICLISAFSLIVIALRYYGAAISQTEIGVARYLLTVLGVAIVLGPISLYISNRLGKLNGRKEEI